MAITHLNPKLWIRIYNGFVEIPDLSQTGITENLATFSYIYLLNLRWIILCLLLVYDRAVQLARKQFVEFMVEECQPDFETTGVLTITNETGISVLGLK